MIRFLTIVFFFLVHIGHAQHVFVVDASGKGDSKTIQGALNMAAARDGQITIKVRKGIYREKIYVEKANLTIEGEDSSNTIIMASIARDEWRCQIKDDWGVATVNVGASDLTLKNLTIVNNYGFEHLEDRNVICANDSGVVKKIARNGHQMALRVTNNATRLRALRCHFKSFGGDTVSPWEVNNGMWYFKDCIMDGAVDLYCPRGWAWAENCLFIVYSGTAAIWHDGSVNQDSKTVLKNCRFNGYDQFLLGRYHKDAQFYLIDCHFPANMKDRAIYNVPGNTLKWGHRVFYIDCTKDGAAYAWYQNNLPKDIHKEMIDPAWVFGTKWDPLKN